MQVRVPRLSGGLARAVALFLLFGAVAGTAIGQPREPIPWFAVDLQGALPKLPTDPALATPRGVAAATLPVWGPGFNLAAHVYPLKHKIFALGIGANYQWARGSDSPDIPKGSTTPTGPTVTTRFKSFAPQVTFNFGHRRGWSYFGGGIGSSTLTISRDDRDEETGEGIKTINYGGGGRWFVKEHLAFSWDLRIYAMNPQEAGDYGAGHPRVNLVIMNIGVSFQ